MMESFLSSGAVSRNCFNEYLDSDPEWLEVDGEGARIFLLLKVSMAKS